jgi:hypothetical protein
MPLLDHFAPPLAGRRHWHSFHNGWAYCISTQLNSLLPLGYFAEANVQYGIEIDVAAFEEAGAMPPVVNYTPSAPNTTLPTTFTEAVVEVGIFSRSGGPQLAGAVELVSPANKDRPETRQALVNKVATYIQAGVGVVLVDVVTERSADLHHELLARLGGTGTAPGPLFASAYRPVTRDGASQLDVWLEPAALGHPLPTMPLWLRGGLCLPVELEATYERTCTEQRVRLVA